MPNAAAVALLAARLPAGLVHPGDPENNVPPKPILLPQLGNLGLSPEQAAQFAQEAGMPTNDAPKAIAEAIVSMLETDGEFELVPRAEIEEMRASAATPSAANPTVPTVSIHCRCNKTTPILQLAVGRARVVMDGKALRKQLDDVCECG